MNEDIWREVGDGVNVDKYGDSGADDGDDNGTPPLKPNLQEATPIALIGKCQAYGKII